MDPSLAGVDRGGIARAEWCCLFLWGVENACVDAARLFLG